MACNIPVQGVMGGVTPHKFSSAAGGAVLLQRMIVKTIGMVTRENKVDMKMIEAASSGS